MIGQLVRPEVARAWQDFFSAKGGESPAVPSEVVGVVLLDDNSKGPYPAHRPWQFGMANGPGGAGIFSHIAWSNMDDPATQKSAVVVDHIAVKAGAQTDFLVGILPRSGVITFANGPVSDANMEKDPQLIGSDSRLGNVACGANGSPTGTWLNAFFPGNVPFGAVQMIPGPFIVGPGMAVVVTTQIANILLTAWARGRYYPSL